MIQKMLITDVITILKDREPFLKKVRDLKRKHGSSSSEFKKQMKKWEKEMPQAVYLEEDCSLLAGSGFKRGRQITLEEAKRLKDLGFQLLWISDQTTTESQKKKDFGYVYKNEVDSLLTKYMVILDETYGKKPGSNIKYLEKNDLLKQTIEAIQLDGAKYLARSIFGESARIVKNLKVLILQYYKKVPDKVNLSDNICLGNAYKLKSKKNKDEEAKEKGGAQTEERSNFIQRFMSDIGLAFMTTISRIQQERLKRNPNDRPQTNRRPDPNLRHGYDEENLIEGALGAFFAEYGYLHFAIDNIILRFTQPYYSDEGEINGSGLAKLSDKNQLVFNKHCNVSYHLFNSMKDNGFVGLIARDILQYHHRGLNNSGYPKRKLVDERVSQTDVDGNVQVLNEKVFDTKIHEMTRLVAIISFFIEYSNQTPFHIPFQRDGLVRHMLLNSVWPPNRTNNPDTEGIYEIATQIPQNKRFDGYLVDRFLKSINIFKIGEKVPIYNFNNTKKELYDAVVTEYNEMPHRPVVKILDGDKESEIDLSSNDNSHLYIGEYIPSLRFQDVIDEFHLDKVEGGMLMADQTADDDLGLMSRDEEETAKLMDDIWDDNPQLPGLPVESGETIDIDALLADLPPGIAQTQSVKDDVETPEEMDMAPEEDLMEDETSDSLIDLEDAVESSLEEVNFTSPQDGLDIPIVEELDDSVEEDLAPEPQMEEEVTFKPPADVEVPSGGTIGKDELMDLFDDDPFDESENEDSLDIEEKAAEAFIDNELVDEAPMGESETMPDFGEDKTLDGDMTDTFNEMDFPEPAETITLDEDVEEEMVDTADDHDFILDDHRDEALSDELMNFDEEKLDRTSSRPSKDSLYTIDLKLDKEMLPYGLGQLVSATSSEKKFRITYLSQCVEEALSHYTYQYSLLSTKDQHVITVYDPDKTSQLPFGALKFFVSRQIDTGQLERKMSKPYPKGSYHLLYYIEDLDPRKGHKTQSVDSSRRGIPKYIVQIMDEDPNGPIVQFVRYIRIQDENAEYVKDKNCGNNFNLSDMPFFRIDRELSANEVIRYFNLHVA